MTTRVLYHLTVPRTARPQLDAVVQEVDALRARFGGEVMYVNPARRPGSRWPERLYGLPQLPRLLRRETGIDAHHIYNPHLFAFPYLRWLRKPIVYTVTAGLRSAQPPPRLDRLAILACIAVSAERERQRLQGWGLRNVVVVQAGIDVTRFTRQPLPDTSGFTLLAGSAPWTRGQFESKGVDALLQTAQTRPDLRLIFLWRDLLFDEMRRRVAQAGLTGRVTILDQQVDVNHVLAQVHAAVVLASDSALVKAYPHSLLEALTAGRPVMVSREIPMSEWVARTGCGVVVEAVHVGSISSALAALIDHYAEAREAALRLDRESFSLDRMTQSYHHIYRRVTASVD